MTSYPLAEKTERLPAPMRRTAWIYATLLIVGIFSWALSLGVLAWITGPPVGDLGRISGLGSRDFGRHGQFEFYAQDHFTRGPLQEYLVGEAPADILIFGDSFSGFLDIGESWINEVYAQTGLRPHSVPLSGFQETLSYLASPEFKKNPPQAIIVQSVERNIVSRALAIYDPGSCMRPLLRRSHPLKLLAPGPLPQEIRQAKTGFDGLDELLSWGFLSARMRLMGQDKVLPVTLSRERLFSNSRGDQVLIYFKDVTNHTSEALGSLSAQEAATRVQCGLRRLVAAAGEVPLWVIIAPDKRSVYTPWITTPLPEKILNISDLVESALGPAYINLQPLLRTAASSGQIDLYWPDDTHWGVAGHRLVGEHVAAQMKSQPLPLE